MKRRRTNWTLDKAALREAADFLGLTLPVYITKSPTRRTHGWYSLSYAWALPQSAPAALRGSGLVHRINICSYDSPAQASRTIWHELAHAMQSEHVMDATQGNHFAKFRAWCRVADSTAQEAALEAEADSYEQYATEIAPASVTNVTHNSADSH